MPQIIVDTATESPASLSLVSRLLQDYAIMKAKEEQQAAHEYPAVASDSPLDPSHVTVRVGEVSMTGDPAVFFAKATATTAVPAAPVPVPQTAPVAATPAPTTAPVATAPSAPAAMLEYDTAGVPWDARIHSSAKGKKKDGTWKLARNIDPALVTMVLHEITPKPAVGTAAAPVASPVTVPVAPVAVPVPPEGSALPVAVPGTAPVVPVAAQPAAGGVPVAPNPMQQFQSLMAQISAAKAAGTLNQTTVLDAVKAEGLAQLQLLITAPDKIPAVKARLGLV